MYGLFVFKSCFLSIEQGNSGVFVPPDILSRECGWTNAIEVWSPSLFQAAFLSRFLSLLSVSLMLWHSQTYTKARTFVHTNSDWRRNDVLCLACTLYFPVICVRVKHLQQLPQHAWLTAVVLAAWRRRGEREPHLIPISFPRSRAAQSMACHSLQIVERLALGTVSLCKWWKIFFFLATLPHLNVSHADSSKSGKCPCTCVNFLCNLYVLLLVSEF